MDDYDDIWGEIKCKVSLIDEMERNGLTLIKSGRRLKCVCPFHSDSDPSMIINIEGDIETYKCFGCAKKGSVIDFIMDYRKISLSGALDYFKNNYNLIYAKDIDLSTLINTPKAKKRRENIIGYMFCFSKIIREFIQKSETPREDFMKLKQIIILADEACYLSNLEYVKKTLDMVKKSIKDIKIMRELIKKEC
jgi:DNA primase